MALKVKSRAPKVQLPLSIPLATRQARQIVSRIIPGAGVTVASRLSHDLSTDTATMITSIMFLTEVTDGQVERIVEHLATLAGYREVDTIQGPHRIVITRKR